MNQKTKHTLIEIMPRLLWVIVLGTLIWTHVSFGLSPTMSSDPARVLIGIGAVIAGVVYALWVFSYIGKAMFDKSLVTTGPYAYARHPMYAAIYLILIGVGLVYFGELWFAILLGFLPVWYIDCRIEESQMTDLYPDEYPEYRRQVGMFFPRF